MRRWLPLLLLGIAALSVALVALLPGRVFFPFHTAQLDPWRAEQPSEDLARMDDAAVGAMGDKVLQHHLYNVAARRAVQAGEFPWWTSAANGGLPLLGTCLPGILYPLNWPFFLLDPLDWYGWHLVLHLLIAGLLTYALGRELGLIRGAALLGAVCFALSGWMAAHAHYHMMLAAAAWLPGILLGLHRLMRGERGSGLALFALSVGLSLLAGFPGASVIGLHLAAVATLVLLAARWRRAGKGAAARRAGVVLAALGAGLLLALPQLVSSLAFKAQWARRTPTLEVLAENTLEAPHTLALVWPAAFGSVEGFALAAPTGERPPVNLPNLLWLEPPTSGASLTGNLPETTSYLGILALVFLASTLVVGTSASGALYLMLAAFSAAVAWGIPAVTQGLFRWLPGHDLGPPSRYLLGLALSGSVLAAIQLDRLLRRRSPRTERFAIALMGAGMLAALASLAFEHRDPAALGRRLFETQVNHYAQAAGNPAAAAAVHDRDYAWNFERCASAGRHVALLCSVGGAVLLLCLRRRNWWLTLLPAVFAGLDLGAHFRRWIPAVERAGLYATHPVLETIQRLEDSSLPPRITRAGLGPSDVLAGRVLPADPARAPGPGTADMLFPPNLLLVHGIDDLQGYTVPFERFEELVDQIEPGIRRFGSGTNAPAAYESLDSPILDLLGVRFVIARALGDRAAYYLAERGFAEIAAGGGVVLLENREALPRLFFAGLAHRPASEEELLRLLRDPGFDGSSCVLLPPEFPDERLAELPMVGAPGRSSKIPRTFPFRVRPGPCSSQEIRARVFIPPNIEGGYLVHTDAWAPGWEAWVDGTPAEVLRVDHALRAVVVRGAGVHDVRFKYREGAVKWTLPLALLAALAIALLLLRRPRRLVERLFPAEGSR